MVSEMRLRARSTSSTLTLTMSPGLDHLARVVDERSTAGSRAPAVLVHAQVDEGAELATLLTVPSSVMPGCRS